MKIGQNDRVRQIRNAKMAFQFNQHQHDRSMMVMMMKPPAKAAPNEVYEKDYGKSPIYIPVTAAQTFDPI